MDEEIDPAAGLEEETGVITEERTLEDSPEGNQSEDPLDKLTDPEEIRNEAKKYRGIASRKDKVVPVAPKVETPVAPVVSPDVLTKKDFYKANEKKAIRIVTTVVEGDPDAEVKTEIEKYFDRVKLYYTPRHGKDTPEDIAEDLMDAHTVWKRREGSKVTKTNDTAAELATVTVTKPGGSKPVAPVSTPAEDPRFKQATPVSEWYKRPEQK